MRRRVPRVCLVGGWLAALILAGCSDAPSVLEPLAPPVLPSAKLSAQGGRLLDALGREILLRGVNAGGRSKLPPFFAFPFAESGRPEQAADLPFELAADLYVARLEDWGHNVVRLPLSWEALEPTRGSYDEQYLDRYVALAERLGQGGIRVIVDFHQDVFARPLCGDGFPRWALPDPGIAQREPCDSSWYGGYFDDPEVDAAFDRFWSNEDGLLDSFEAMWRHVAARTWPVEAVLGFDVMNEPHPGSMARASWSRDVLGPFYARMVAALREVAPAALVVLEPSGLDAVDGATDLTLPDAEGLIFEVHYYAAAVFMLGPETSQYDTDADLLPWATLRDDWDVPLLVGEFGSKTGTAGGGRYMTSNLRSLDRYQLHGTAWEYSTTTDDWNDEGYSVTGYGGEETPSATALVRSYPRAVAGRVRSFVFDETTRDGELQFEAEPGLSEIVAPRRLYPSGVSAALEGSDGRASWDAERGVLLVETRGAGAATVRFGPLLGREQARPLCRALL